MENNKNIDVEQSQAISSEMIIDMYKNRIREVRKTADLESADKDLDDLSQYLLTLKHFEKNNISFENLNAANEYIQDFEKNCVELVKDTREKVLFSLHKGEEVEVSADLGKIIDNLDEENKIDHEIEITQRKDIIEMWAQDVLGYDADRISELSQSDIDQIAKVFRQVYFDMEDCSIDRLDDIGSFIERCDKKMEEHAQSVDRVNSVKNSRSNKRTGVKKMDNKSINLAFAKGIFAIDLNKVGQSEEEEDISGIVNVPRGSENMLDVLGSYDKMKKAYKDRREAEEKKQKYVA